MGEELSLKGSGWRRIDYATGKVLVTFPPKVAASALTALSSYLSVLSPGP